jgi:hypothetical protein
MGRFKRSKRKPNKERNIIIFNITEIPVWLDIDQWEFEKKWREAQISRRIRLTNSK